jgi:hypothetical protein
MRAVIATGLALGLVVLPPTTARAASPGPDVQQLPAKADPSAEVRALHELGMARFEAGEYDEALVKWKRAFVLVPRDENQQVIRNVLVANIVAAHSRAYEVGHNPEHLAEAIRVIDLRKRELDQFHTWGKDPVRESLDAQWAELARLHELALSNGETPSKLAAGTEFLILPASPPPLTRQERDAAVRADPEVGASYRHGKRMSDWGTVALAVGGAGMGITLLYAAVFEPKDGLETDVLPMVIPPGIIAAALMITGGTLLAVGSKRKKQARQGYEERQSPAGMLVPISLQRGAGLGFVGRF